MQGRPVQVRIHTGLVVVGEIGGGERRERFAVGEAPAPDGGKCNGFLLTFKKLQISGQCFEEQLSFF